MVQKEIIADGDLHKLSEKYGKHAEKLGLKKRSVQNGHLKTMLLETESPFFKILRDCRKKSIIQRK